jgi:hypothetical protein
MQFFDNESFKKFLGLSIYEQNHAWGIEKHFRVESKNIADFIPILRDTLYLHHSSFNYVDEIIALGFPLSGEATRTRNSGLPSDLKTRMAHLGEVIGAEFAKVYLGYQTTITFPKRLNPNPEQSMKGVDVLGLREETTPAEILLGEVKSYTTLDKRVINEAHVNLKRLSKSVKIPILFHFAKEYFSLLGNNNQIKNIDRHMAENIPKNCLLLSITQGKSKAPFSGIPNEDVWLMAVHIQLENIRSFLPQLFI